MGKTASGNLAARTSAVTFVVVVALAGSAFAAVDATKPAATAGSPSQPVATFTGEYVQGAPVYRLPPVTVSTSRAAALAAIAQEDKAAAASAGQLAATAFVAAAATPAQVVSAAPATDVPERNIALDVAVAGIASLAAFALSFGLVAGRRRQRRVVLPQPRQWVAAQPSAPTIDAMPASHPELQASPAQRVAVSLTEQRMRGQRERQQAARRPADAAQPDAA